MPLRYRGPATAAAVLLFAAFYAAVFYQSLTSGLYIAPSDSLDFGLAAFLSPQTLWTDGMYSGYPIAADPQSMTFYPPFQAARWLGAGWNAFMISAFVIASTTAFVLVRSLTGSALAGAFAGVVYGFSGPMLAHLSHFNQIHAAAWVPLFVHGLQRIREGDDRPGILLSSSGLAMMWLAGHPQVTVYALYMSAAFVALTLFTDRPERDVMLRRLRTSGLAVLLGLGLAAVLIVPLLELGELSRRAAPSWELYASKALPPLQLVSLVLPLAFGGFWSESPVPNLGMDNPVETMGYSGLLAVGLAAAAPLVRGTARGTASIWLLLAGCAALLCLGGATPVGRLFYYAPGYAGFRVPARHLFLLAFCVSVASGIVFA